MRNVFLKGMLALYCVIISLSASALPINDFACSQSGGGTVTPNVAEACVVWDIQSLNDRVSYNYSGDVAGTGGVVPTLSALSATGATLFNQLVIQLDQTFTESNILNPSAGFIGVGILDGVYGAIFENFAEEFSVTFETKTLPKPGRFSAFGTDRDGTAFSYDVNNVLVPGMQLVEQAIPEPPTVPLILIGSLWMINEKVSRRRRAMWG